MTRVEVMIDGLRQSPANGQWVIVLKEKLRERYLPIWVNASQAEVIKSELVAVRPPGDVTPDFPPSVVNIPNFKLQSVRIDQFENNAFGAKLFGTSNNRICEVSSPVSTALVAAVRARVPILIEEAVLNRSGISISS